ncbi:MAG: DUF1080 domain-containing protein [Cyclobacteriaceae bacterium]
MTVKYFNLILAILLIAAACSEQAPDTIDTSQESVITLPAIEDDFTSFDSFKDPGANWVLASNVFADRQQAKHLDITAGTGVLANNQSEANKAHLITSFEHKDIDIEIEVLMPNGSNSGIYLQSRYEVQLLDSWGVKQPKHGDMGGLYQRWDDTQPEGQEGYEGVPPMINAALAPGLWQKFHISFQAPRFDETGNKISNALFKRVELNGHLIHENIELNGPTRGAVSNEEVPYGPILIQGDHGPVAFRNLKYKLFDEEQVSLSDLTVSQYEYEEDSIANLASLEPSSKQISTDSISHRIVDKQFGFLLDYQGQINIPTDGDYLFEFNISGRCSGRLIIGDQMLINKTRGLPEDNLAIVNLVAGSHSFRLIYNQPIHAWNSDHLQLFVEGPQIARKALHAPSANWQGRIPDPILVEATEEAVTQRTFVMHNGSKRTHCISVGTPQSVNYTVDLQTGALIRAWAGRFLETTSMWHSRGNNQLGQTLDGPKITLSNHVIFSTNRSTWSDSVKHKGYELNEQGIPIFSYQTKGATLTDKSLPREGERGITRTISSNQSGWVKLASGKTINELPDGTYSIDDKSYYLAIQDKGQYQPYILQENESMSLIVPLVASITYEIIW